MSTPSPATHGLGVEPIGWANNRLRLLDQTRLPGEEVWLEIEDYREVAEAIREMRVRGAPAIGVTAAYGVALAARKAASRDMARFLGELDTAIEVLGATRPTAVNLFWALRRVRAVAEAGKQVSVVADETRPLLQGARLTAWELARDGIPTTLIADTMAGSFMRRGLISCAVVGADRIAANGDVANKIGTYQVAVLAHENGIPFYVAAPMNTLDLSLSSGDDIPIEERRPDEVTHFAGVATAPGGISVANPAFDVTPARYVTAIITERGIARPPYTEALRALMNTTTEHGERA
ncbi:MAG: S-methyl-5-thioribose-1-phosphate isomerase [Chloroflexi bacterium]|nr:S-methyl-5-thioribose-1-phosphate isomerase [Chloroflexota bacterium]